MSYKKGDLKCTAMVPCGHEWCEGKRSCEETGQALHVTDARDDESSFDRHGAYLPHSCNEWFIGGKDEIVDLIEDLREVLERM